MAGMFPAGLDRSHVYARYRMAMMCSTRKT